MPRPIPPLSPEERVERDAERAERTAALHEERAAELLARMAGRRSWRRSRRDDAYFACLELIWLREGWLGLGPEPLAPVLRRAGFEPGTRLRIVPSSDDPGLRSHGIPGRRGPG